MRPAKNTGFRPALALVGPLALLLGCCSGCGSNFRMPNLFHPGPTGPQRYDAIYHDPYPLPDLGPEVVGGRPRVYQQPVPEVTRGRLFRPPQASAGVAY
ncbi:hypothetical protein KOR34_07510 [Posidoniimonas corsicana]|uniref:Lipoprotein n=1 Tax=Posidoniimonas corsicana TaxID=1938618 RepID=A0A5C5VB56_9BACT|nr:membrane or secreted protein [Posidoniimonas corsicana]TWT35856.1 hypothetical protein KOR34_07510 [Posidoniimonas corsicana]